MQIYPSKNHCISKIQKDLATYHRLAGWQDFGSSGGGRINLTLCMFTNIFTDTDFLKVKLIFGNVNQNETYCLVRITWISKITNVNYEATRSTGLLNTINIFRIMKMKNEIESKLIWICYIFKSKFCPPNGIIIQKRNCFSFFFKCILIFVSKYISYYPANNGCKNLNEFARVKTSDLGLHFYSFHSSKTKDKFFEDCCARKT